MYFFMNITYNYCLKNDANQAPFPNHQEMQVDWCFLRIDWTWFTGAEPAANVAILLWRVQWENTEGRNG